MRLTFDDGPDPRFTPQVLDVLGQADVKATFYCVGRRALAWPELVRRIAADGHAVGSHTMTHPDLSALDPLAAMSNIRAGRRAVGQALGAPVARFRAPFGRLGISGRIALAALRMQHEHWDLDPEDWAPEAEATALVAKLRQLGPAAVVLLHDGSESPTDPRGLDRSQTVETLRILFGS